MQDVLIPFIFGFGLVSVALLFLVLGILNDKVWLVIIGAILFVPFSYYLFGASGADAFTLFPPLLLIGSGVAVHEKYKLWAWILLAPALLETLWVLGVVLFYNFS